MGPDLQRPERCTTIESLGVYLPDREVSTEDVLRGCRTKVRFPLERLTGIKSRRVAGDSEFALDLAKEAIDRCLATSRFGPDDVDVIVSVAIARLDGPDFLVSYEPATSVRLKHHFGFDQAIAFDVRSACSGMFAGIEIVDALIQQGVIRCGLVVSGEFITHLATTAQLEIEEMLDSRLACLTLGDSGAAVMLAATSADGAAGFAAIDLCTLGAYADSCIAGPTEQEHGGAIMFTDAVKLTDAAARHGSEQALNTLRRAGWSAESFDHLIMHQTSRTALNSATRAINQLMRGRVCHEGNTIDNLERRGNTATTTHFVALADGIRSGRIRSGDRIIFAVSGSGLTLGTALYTLDDLPDRFRGARPVERTDVRSDSEPTGPATAAARVRIACVGTASRDPTADSHDSMATLDRAANDCLERWGRDRNEIDLLIYAGTYRSRFVTEPAIAALLAGKIGINSAGPAANGKRTLAFDVFNGAVGILNACQVAMQLIHAGKATTALIVVAETENNAVAFPDELLGIRETGSALLLDEAPGDDGFEAFRFSAVPEGVDTFVSHLTNRNGKTYLKFSRTPDLERRYIDAIVETVTGLFDAEGIDPSRLARIFPPQISSRFIAELSDAMDLPPDLFVDAVQGGSDLFTSSVPFALRHAQEHGLVRGGELGLIVTAGSGLQVGCALYRF
jgi:3-oxoacyl-[acyl-carrier-protein] synthase III